MVKQCAKYQKQATEMAERDAKLGIFKFKAENKTVAKEVNGVFDNTKVCVEPADTAVSASPIIKRTLAVTGGGNALVTRNAERDSSLVVEAVFDALKKQSFL